MTLLEQTERLIQEVDYKAAFDKTVSGTKTAYTYQRDNLGGAQVAQAYNRFATTVNTKTDNGGNQVSRIPIIPSITKFTLFSVLGLSALVNGPYGIINGIIDTITGLPKAFLKLFEPQDQYIEIKPNEVITSDLSSKLKDSISSSNYREFVSNLSDRIDAIYQSVKTNSNSMFSNINNKQLLNDKFKIDNLLKEVDIASTKANEFGEDIGVLKLLSTKLASSKEIVSSNIDAINNQLDSEFVKADLNNGILITASSIATALMYIGYIKFKDKYRLIVIDRQLNILFSENAKKFPYLDAIKSKANKEKLKFISDNNNIKENHINISVSTEALIRYHAALFISLLFGVVKYINTVHPNDKTNIRYPTDIFKVPTILLDDHSLSVLKLYKEWQEMISIYFPSIKFELEKHMNTTFSNLIKHK